MKIYFKTFTQKWNKPVGKQFPTGSRVYVGKQGSGKSLSLTFDVIQLQKEFPNCIIFSNMMITGLKNFNLIETDADVVRALSVRNGSDGVCVVLDEAHLYFGKKSGISLDVLTAISQQRKDRRTIWFTSQIWEELDISLRKQVKTIVSCKCLLNKIQINSVSNGESLHYDKLHSCYAADHIGTIIFKHSQELYDRYDTLQKIITNNEYNRLPTESEKYYTVELSANRKAR